MQRNSDQPSNVIPFPHAAFVLEVKSDRFMDLVRALHAKGFQISNTGRANRFAVEDQKESQ